MSVVKQISMHNVHCKKWHLGKNLHIFDTEIEFSSSRYLLSKFKIRVKIPSDRTFSLQNLYINLETFLQKSFLASNV